MKRKIIAVLLCLLLLLAVSYTNYLQHGGPRVKFYISNEVKIIEHYPTYWDWIKDTPELREIHTYKKS